MLHYCAFALLSISLGCFFILLLPCSNGTGSSWNIRIQGTPCNGRRREGFLGLLKHRAQGVRYLFYAPSLLRARYNEVEGNCFRIATPSNNHLMVTSEKHIYELSHAPFDKLSLHAVAKEILQPKYTMYGFEWKDKRGVEGTGFVRALRSLLTAHLPVLRPVLRTIISENFDSQIKQNRGNNGTHRVRIFSVVKQVVTQANCLVFFGPELAKNEEFITAALEFPQSVFSSAEVLRVTPNCLKPLVAYVMTKGHRASKTLMKYLLPVVKARLRARDKESHTARPIDCMQWVIDTSPRKTVWTAERMIGELLGLWFGSVHQLAIATTFAIHDLCIYQDWVHELRNELRKERGMGFDRSMDFDVESLILLDCFAQESMRLNTSDAISTRRKAIVPFTFSDGLRVPVNDWVCIPQQAMMHDARIYPEPTLFNPLRFQIHPKKEDVGGSDPNVASERRRLTDVHSKFPVWGLGTAACPGRFYASLCMKLLLIHIIEHYDCTKIETRSASSFSWRSSIVPRSSTVVILREVSDTCEEDDNAESESGM